ncbi:sucrose transporter, putative [Aspergillus fumigatus A1163]|uniref:Sucrose transporter, putative n=1 Tax=Aspergillus fumigatus (strain CBS 144.89 / FGSC A1163 / CEA10) TaxID=451804 RepID=B0XYE3_ASPFC|nr:sucrose transporter, putative [Aspergillus fumigatus A1163]
MPQAARWVGSPSIKGKSESMRMALLTFSLLGLQFTWGIEMTFTASCDLTSPALEIDCTPYLLQLGLTKSRTSLVWIAGPLSGLIIQPLIGVIADRSRSKWGRRRPFMVVGSGIVAVCLLVLGWTTEIVSLFVKDAEKAKNVTIALAVLSIYAVDFAINIVQACCRSLIVDTLPIPLQQAGSAWGTPMEKRERFKSFLNFSRRQWTFLLAFRQFVGRNSGLGLAGSPSFSTVLLGSVRRTSDTKSPKTLHSQATFSAKLDASAPPDSKRSRFTPRPPPGIAALLKRITAIRPDLQTSWMISHVMFAATMIFAPLARSRAFATCLVALCGIPWAISSWAPFAFMGVEINKLAMGPAAAARSSGVTMITSSTIRSSNFDTDTEMDVLRLNHHDTDSDSDSDDDANIPSTGELAGIYLGVLNLLDDYAMLADSSECLTAFQHKPLMIELMIIHNMDMRFCLVPEPESVASD